MTDKQYPPYQWSMFVGGKSEQYVIRTEDLEDLLLKVGELKAKVDIVEVAETVKAKDPDPEWTQNISTVIKCKTCGKEMTFKEGISAKSGKPWKGWFCEDKSHPVEWVK